MKQRIIPWRKITCITPQKLKSKMWAIKSAGCWKLLFWIMLLKLSLLNTHNVIPLWQWYHFCNIIISIWHCIHFNFLASSVLTLSYRSILMWSVNHSFYPPSIHSFLQSSIRSFLIYLFVSFNHSFTISFSDMPLFHVAINNLTIWTSVWLHVT